MSRLYLVGTPIGNLGDLSPRAVEVLGSVDFIAAEDTRVTLKLLNHFGIKKPLVSYYAHNLRERVPGPSAAVTALAVSGLPTSRFAFEGFLSVKRNSRTAHLAQVKDDPRTLIFYEAPHKLLATLNDLLEAFGNRRISLARELTKLHEEVRRTTL